MDNSYRHESQTRHTSSKGELETPHAKRQAQNDLLEQFEGLLIAFNNKINLISPNTVSQIRERHVEHCLTLTMKSFPAGSRVVDWGTGGGLPAIPLAICFPDVQFTAIDAVSKKIQAVRAMARKLDLSNLDAWHGRAEAWPGRTHYSVSRATAPLLALWNWHKRVAQPLVVDHESYWQPGLICLKGGNLEEEIATLKSAFPSVDVITTSLAPLHPSKFFAEKYIVSVR